MHQQFAYRNILLVRILQERQIIRHPVCKIEASAIVQLHHSKQRGCGLCQRSDVVYIRLLYGKRLASGLVPDVGTESFIIHLPTILQHHHLAAGVSPFTNAFFSYLVYFSQQTGIHTMLFGYKAGGALRSQRHSRTGSKPTTDTGRQASL